MIGSRLAAAAALIVLVAYAYAGTQKAPGLRPIFRTDLRALGWQPPRKMGRGLYYPAPHSPMFLSDGTLVVSLFVENQYPGLSIRGKKFGGQRLFKAFFFDTQSWSVVRSSVLANAGVSTGLFPGPDGNFAVWDNFDLTEHGADGRTLATLELDSHTLRRYFHAFASPSGATLFVESTDRTGTSLLVLRAADLHSFGWFNVPGCYEYRASDSYIACYRQRADSLIMEVLVSPIGPDNHTHLDFRSVFSGGTCLSAAFLSEDTIALGNNCNDLTILNVLTCPQNSHG